MGKSNRLDSDEVLLKMEDVIKITGLSRHTIWVMIKEGRFPKPGKVGRYNVWLKSTVMRWMRQVANGR